MRVFVAGATGAIGRPLVRALVEHGHRVVAMTHRESSAEPLRHLGATPVVVDALDAPGVHHALAAAQPEVVVDELTALPAHFSGDALRESAPGDTRVRLEGGANVLRAAIEVGATRYIAQSSGFWCAPGDGLADEDTPLAVDVDAAGVAS